MQAPLGFNDGFRSLFAGIARLWRLPRSWPFAVIPAAIFLLAEGLCLALALKVVRPWVVSALTAEGELRALAAETAGWLSTGVVVVLGWVVSGFLAPVLSAPALERIVSLVEQDLAAPPRAALGFWRELWCGLRSQLLGGGLAVSLVLALTLVEIVAPPAVVITTPSKLLIGALGLAWALFDYPLTLRGVRVRQRFAFFRQHAACVTGFGCAFALAFWIPCCGILLLPAGVAGATELLDRLSRPRLTVP